MDRKQELLERKCTPCEGGVDPLNAAQVGELCRALHPDWTLDEKKTCLTRKLSFPGFNRTIAFVNALGWIATVEGHHPDINFGYGYCTINYTTHAIKGLSDNDFICAAKIDRLLEEL